MTSPQNTMPTRSTNRVQIVVLRVLLFTEPSGGILAPWTSLSMSSTSILGLLSFSICDCDHRLSYLIPICFCTGGLDE